MPGYVVVPLAGTRFQSKTVVGPRFIVGYCLALTLFLLLLLSDTQAPAAHAADPPGSPPIYRGGLTLQVDVGFNSFYRIGYWTPIRITLNNQGPDFSGTLAINTVSGQPTPGGAVATSPWSFEEAVTLARGMRKQVALTVPLYMGLFAPHGILARLLDTHGHAVVTQESSPEYLSPVVRRLKQPKWGWRIITSGIVIFSLLSYGISFYQRRASLLDNSISIVQINADGSPAHITTYHGVFVPNETDFKLQLQGNNLALPLSDLIQPGSPAFSEGDLPSAIMPTLNGESVNLPNAGIWPFHALVSEQDRQLRGGISAHLALQNNRLTGSITNTLDVSLNDVYVLMPHSFVPIGHLSSGHTQQVDIPLQRVPAISGITLAGAIAMSNGLPASYFPFDQDQQPRSDFQRHLAILSALSGAGSPYGPCGAPCITSDIVSKGGIITPPPGTPLTISLPKDNDPLLLSSAPATLIGWADAPLDASNGITINGSRPNGFHDNLVQAALDIDFAATSNVPPDVIAGYVIDKQNSDAEDTVPNTYSLSTGSVIFEFALPNSKQASIGSLTLTEPNAIGNTNLTTASSSNTDLIQAHLYNWQTMSWDSIPLTAWTFTTSNTAAYLGPGGRVLLQIANRDPEGLLIFGKPSLSLKRNDTGA